MKRIGSLLIIGVLAILGAASTAGAANIGRSVYGIFSETYPGIIYNSANPPDTDGAKMLTYHNASTGGITISDDVTISTEGTKCLRAVTGGTTGGSWWTQYGTASSRVQTNMQAYSGGTVEFMIKNSAPVQFFIEWGTDGKASQTIAANDTWHKVSYSLSSFSSIDLSAITVPAGFSASAGTFYVDNVIWKAADSGSFSAQLKNISGGDATSVTWSDVVLGTTRWKAADQYIELNLDYSHAGWGIQIYTDNASAGSSPRFTGTGDPSGLICISTTTKRLPLCWRVVDVSTNTLTIQQGTSGYPYRLWEETLGNGYPCFIWMKDRHTPAVENSTAFADGQDYCTAWDVRGIQHAEDTWDGAISPNYIYIGADFTNAMTPETYTTGRLIVELFYE